MKVSADGDLAGSFEVEVNGGLFQCSFTYQAAVSSPTFKSSKKGKAAGNIQLHYQQPESNLGIAHISITIISVSSKLQ